MNYDLCFLCSPAYVFCDFQLKQFPNAALFDPWRWGSLVLALEIENGLFFVVFNCPLVPQAGCEQYL